MFSLRPLVPVLLTCLAIGFCGCGKSETATASNDVSDDDFLTDLLGDIDLTDGRPAEVPVEPPITTVSALEDTSQPIVPAVAAMPSNVAERLELRLAPGDRYPLIKIVRQTLNQKSEQFPAVAQTQLELQMFIEVEQVQSEASLLKVVYTQVGYQQDINGQRLGFDSSTHQGPVPLSVAPYFGMVNNGFSFWLGKDNAIKELVGYDQFLQRCVQQVPAENRAAMLAKVADKFGKDGVANFVDDVIGLLPYNRGVEVEAATRVAVGDVWTRQRRLMQSVPVNIQSTCRLESLTDQTATINITGTIAAVNNGNAVGPVKINSGRTMGSCVVDRSTGLPIQLTRSSFLTLEVTTANGQTVQQDKQIETSIQTLSTARGTVVSAPPQQLNRQRNNSGPQYQNGTKYGGQVSAANYQQPAYGQSGIQQTSGIRPQQIRNPAQQLQQPRQGRIDTSALQSTTTAVYPD